MKKLRWQILIVFLTLIVVGILLLTQQQPAEAPTLPEPASGGIYTEALIGSFSRLNPLLDLNNPADRDIDRLLFSSLIVFDSRGIPQPDLAESWGISADGTMYNVSLRPNAYWHDGTPITSDDVLFTIGLLRSEYSAYPEDVRAMWDQIEITRLDDKNIKFTIPEPFAPFLDYLTFGVLPKHLLERIPADQLSNADFNLSPIGSGPYRFDRLIVENGKIAGVVLTASENYYRQTPYLEQIVFRYYASGQEALSAYQAGDVLGISEITPDIFSNALAEPNLSFYSSRMPRLSLILLNLGNEQVAFFQDKKVRQALLLGLNRQWIVDRLLNGQAIVANSPLLPSTWAYYDGLEPVSYDADAAATMLKNAGYTLTGEGVRAKDGSPLTFTLLHPNDSLHTQLAEAIQQNWTSIGVGVSLQAVPYDALINDYLSAHNYQAALIDLDLTRSYDPDPYPFWHQAESTGGQNYSGWDNRIASEYLEQARVTADWNIRMRLYRNFQVVFAREVPALLLYYPVYTFGVDQRVRGVQATPLFEQADRFNSIGGWYLLTQRAEEEPTASLP